MLRVATLVFIVFLSVFQSAAIAKEMKASTVASQEEVMDDEEKINDPLEPINRGIYAFNRVVDHLLLRPITYFYMAIIPQPGQTAVHNIVNNLATPLVAVNQLLQGNLKSSLESVWRFIINSTLGIGGIGDVAQSAGLPAVQADFGLTMAKYCMGEGPYIMLPLLGPSNLRDTIGKGADLVLDPMNHLFSRDASTVRFVVTGIDKRRQLDPIITQVEADSFDAYATFRSMYLQSRRGAVQQANTFCGHAPYTK